MNPILIKKNPNGDFDVRQGDRYADGLTYEEVLGVVAHLLHTDSLPYDSWFKTQEEWDAYHKCIVELTKLPLIEDEDELATDK